MDPCFLRPLLCAALIAALLVPAGGNPKQQSEPANFLRANDHLGMSLLEVAHKATPDRNTIVDTLSVSIGLSLFSGYDFVDQPTHDELDPVMGWDDSVQVYPAARMLLARFRPQEKWSPPPFKDPLGQSLIDPELTADRPELWLSAALLHRGAKPFSYWFGYVARDLGFTSHAVSNDASQQEILAANYPVSTPLPQFGETTSGTARNDFWLVAATHLRTTWAGNTFVLSKVQKEDFHVSAERTVNVDVLPSEMEFFGYIHTHDFEAVEMKGWLASIIFVLPSKTSSVQEIEKRLAKDPTYAESGLHPREGKLYLPPFQFKYQADIQAALKQLGVHRIFDSDQAINVTDGDGPGARLDAIGQSSDVTVDRTGIKVDSGTAFAGVYGGILGNREPPFDMHLNRPFIFLIRDTVTRALLYVGVVEDPAQEPQPPSKIGGGDN
jgi:hypothetical protein